MIVQERNIEVVEGDEPLYTFQLRRNDPVTGQLIAYDLTGVELRFTVRANKATGAPNLAEYTSPAGGITKLPPTTDGRATVQVTAAATATPGVFRYYLAVLMAGRPRTILMGNWKVVNR